MIQNPGVMTPREGRSMPRPRSSKSYSVRAARSSPLPLWERSETERSEVSGRGDLRGELPPLPNALPEGERERTAAAETVRTSTRSATTAQYPHIPLVP